MKKPFITTRRSVAVLVSLLFLSACGKQEKDAGQTIPEPAKKTAPAPVTQNIYQAIHNNDTTFFLSWLLEGEERNLQNENGYTPLMMAAEWNRPMYVKDLLKHDVDPNVQNGNGHSALHLAAISNNVEVIELLLTSPINPTLTDADGFTAKDLATMRQYGKAAVLLSEAIDQFLTAVKPVETPDELIDPETEKVILLSTDFREWTSASGDRLDAAFIQTIFDNVILQARDGTMLRIAINRLSSDDQILVRKLSGIDPHALAGVRKTPSANRSRRSSSSSLAERIGNSSGWTKLEGCRLLKNDSNDGDSFHVKHDGKEYIFRLYFVDAAETSNNFPDRVREQARYFKIDTSAALKLGKEASRFTSSVLAGAPFTVYTKWVDARGNSQLKRYFALVETPLGDLDELLTQEGLVRQFGMHVDGGSGQKKANRLHKLESEARNQKAGGWKDN